MYKTESERLRDAGFVETTIQESFGLSDEDMKIIEVKLKLARLLKKHRKRRKLTQHQVALTMNTNQSRFSKIEKADKTVSVETMLLSLYQIGAKNKEISKVFS